MSHIIVGADAPFQKVQNFNDLVLPDGIILMEGGQVIGAFTWNESALCGGAK